MLRRRPPSTLERLLGKDRARRLRKQLAHAAFGTGFVLYKPTLRRAATLGGAGLAGVLMVWWVAFA